MNDSKIILQLKNGNKDAFTRIYYKYWREVYNFTRLYLNSVADSEEVVQEVFVKIWESHETILETSSIQGLLFIMTRNIIFNRKRDSFNETFFNYTILNAFTEETNIESEMDVEILKDYISKLLDQLTPRQKEIFKLSRIEHLSYKEIACRLNISEKTVERHIADALKHLRKNLPPYFIILYIIACYCRL